MRLRTIAHGQQPASDVGFRTQRRCIVLHFFACRPIGLFNGLVWVSEQPRLVEPVLHFWALPRFGGACE